MKNKITNEKLEKYFKLTSSALEKVKKNIVKEKTSDAKEIIEMVSNYLSDARYFEKKEDFVNSFAALNYADRKSTRLNSSHIPLSRMPSSA